jgi:hypothetical protein
VESFKRLGGKLMELSVMLAMEEGATMAERGHVVLGRQEMYICTRCTVLLIEPYNLLRIGVMEMQFLEASVANAMKGGDHWVDGVMVL